MSGRTPLIARDLEGERSNLECRQSLWRISSDDRDRDHDHERWAGKRRFQFLRIRNDMWFTANRQTKPGVQTFTG